MTSRNGSSISYTSYNLPSVINAGTGTSSTLSYGAFRNRYKQIAVTPTSTETTIYVAGLLEKVTRGSSIEYRHLIHGGQGAAAVHTRVAGGASLTYYLHRDHLGSPELITDSSGNEVVRPSFGAFGERRDGTDWSGPPSIADLTDIGNTIRRGFTGHEHLDAVGLIHMNGRVYEPVAGRFLSVDPFTIVGNSQGGNSYSYVLNNPLSLIDPSGYFCEPSEGMSEEEASAWITACNEAYEEAGRFMANYGEYRCPMMDMECQRIVDAIANAAHGFPSGRPSGDNWDEPVSYEFALLNLIALQRELDAWMGWRGRPSEYDTTVAGSIVDTITHNVEVGFTAQVYLLNFAAGVNGRASPDSIFMLSDVGGMDTLETKIAKLGGVKIGPYLRVTAFGDVPTGAHIDDGFCFILVCIGSTVARDGSSSSLYWQVSPGFGPYVLSQGRETPILRAVDKLACREGYPWC